MKTTTDRRKASTRAAKPKGRSRRKQRPMEDDSGVERREHELFTLASLRRPSLAPTTFLVAPHDDGGWELRSRRGKRVSSDSNHRTLDEIMEQAASREVSHVRHEHFRRVTDDRCQVCDADGWVCEFHPDQQIDHLLKNGKPCGGAGAPCSNPRCNRRAIGMMPTLPTKPRARKPE
jgi:hypothetical protein